MSADPHPFTGAGRHHPPADPAPRAPGTRAGPGPGGVTRLAARITLRAGRVVSVPLTMTARAFGDLVGQDQEDIARLCTRGVLPTLPRRHREHYAILVIPAARIYGLEAVAVGPGTQDAGDRGGGDGPVPGGTRTAA